MEEKDIRKLFEEFEPELTSGKIFMNKVANNLKLIDMVNASGIANAKNNRIIAIASFAVGFLSGVVLTLCYPWLKAFIQSLVVSLSPTSEFSDSFIPICVWLLISAVSLCSTFGTYNLIKLNFRQRFNSHMP